MPSALHGTGLKCVILSSLTGTKPRGCVEAMPIEEWWSLYTAFAIMHKECDRALSARELTVPQASVIGFLGTAGRPLTVTRLARRLTQEGQSASSLVDRMCAGGLVERVKDPHDRRVVLVQLTRKGHQMYDILRSTAPAFIDEMFSVLSAEERVTLEGLLRKFTQRNMQRFR
jgi:DNA-binding MarR family transcriptional regulator